MCPKLTRGNQITQAYPKLTIFHVWGFSMGEGGFKGWPVLGLGLWFSGKALALPAHTQKQGSGLVRAH